LLVFAAAFFGVAAAQKVFHSLLSFLNTFLFVFKSGRIRWKPRLAWLPANRFWPILANTRLTLANARLVWQIPGVIHRKNGLFWQTPGYSGI
jgi:hypothetical protein